MTTRSLAALVLVGCGGVAPSELVGTWRRPTAPDSCRTTTTDTIASARRCHDAEVQFQATVATVTASVVSGNCTAAGGGLVRFEVRGDEIVFLPLPCASDSALSQCDRFACEIATTLSLRATRTQQDGLQIRGADGVQWTRVSR
jgi:hypothetical protein